MASALPFGIKPAPVAAIAHTTMNLAPFVKASLATTPIATASKAASVVLPAAPVLLPPRGTGFGAGFGVATSAAAPTQAPASSGGGAPVGTTVDASSGASAAASPVEMNPPRDMPSVSLPGGDRAVAASDGTDTSKFAVELPTWVLVVGAVAVVGLGAFALHRTLPAKKR